MTNRGTLHRHLTQTSYTGIATQEWTFKMLLSPFPKPIKTLKLWFMHENSIMICTVSWGKYRDTYRILRWLYCYSPNTYKADCWISHSCQKPRQCQYLAIPHSHLCFQCCHQDSSVWKCLEKEHFKWMDMQSNFNSSNIFGTREICSR